MSGSSNQSRSAFRAYRWTGRSQGSIASQDGFADTALVTLLSVPGLSSELTQRRDIVASTVLDRFLNARTLSRYAPYRPGSSPCAFCRAIPDRLASLPEIRVNKKAGLPAQVGSSNTSVKDRSVLAADAPERTDAAFCSVTSCLIDAVVDAGSGASFFGRPRNVGTLYASCMKTIAGTSATHSLEQCGDRHLFAQRCSLFTTGETDGRRPLVSSRTDYLCIREQFTKTRDPLSPGFETYGGLSPVAGQQNIWRPLWSSRRL